jgi:signal transduction histidine kinase
VPLQYRNESIGRLYIVAQKPVFVPSDMHFLHKIIERANPIIENIRLVEQLASHAADEERRRIARDIHDSVIQPYLGLQMGLAAIREKTTEHFPELAKQVERLMDVAQMGINDLRRYVTGLKEGEESGGLLPAMRRFAAKFTDATGIAVEIETEGDLRASDRLATEAFQMTAEGLSNVRRHTQATRATVRLACRLGHLVLEIANEGSKRASAPQFTPASITERAAALGGKVRIRSLPDGGSSVVIDIPL